MERIVSLAAVRLRIHELRDHMSELQDRAWPAVGDEERERILVLGADVQEVDLYAVDGCCELGIRVQLRFAAPPVVLRLPVLAELLDRCERNALRPTCNRFCIRPAGQTETCLQVIETRLWDTKAE